MAYNGRKYGIISFIRAGTSFLWLAVAFIVFSGFQASALSLSPVRIVFEGNAPTATVTVTNTTEKERVYRLGWRRLRMTDELALQYVEDGDPAPDLKPAAGMIKISSDRVVLSPGASRDVKLTLHLPDDLPPGEYRSHLWVYPEEVQPLSDTGAGMQIRIRTGYTLPVLVRVGDLRATADLSNFKAVRRGEGITIDFTLSREGNRSLYGNLHFLCDGQFVQMIRGIAVYTEVKKRHLQFDISVPDTACEFLTLHYVAPEHDRLFKGAIMAQATAKL